MLTNKKQYKKLLETSNPLNEMYSEQLDKIEAKFKELEQQFNDKINIDFLVVGLDNLITKSKYLQDEFSVFSNDIMEEDDIDSTVTKRYTDFDMKIRTFVIDLETIEKHIKPISDLISKPSSIFK